METILILIAFLLFSIVVIAFGIWLLTRLKQSQYEVSEIETPEPLPLPPPIEERVNYYGQLVLPEPRNMRKYQSVRPPRVPPAPPTRSIPPAHRPSPVSRTTTVVNVDTGTDLMNPLHPLSPFNPLNQSDPVWPSHQHPVDTPAHTPEPHIHHDSFSGGHSGGGGAGRSWDDSPSYSTPSYESTSSYSSDTSSSSSCGTSSSSCGCD